MITTLDTQSWSRELVTGNAQFVEIAGILYVVSNVRADNTFAVLQSTAAPPAPGPGAVFNQVAQYTFPQPNTGFDPVVAYDAVTAGGPYLHIIGTRNNPTNNRLTDLIKFTYNIATPALTGPFVLTSASTIRNGYDMIVLANGHRVIAVTTIDATMQGAEIPPLFQATVTSTSLSGAPSQPVLTVIANNTFSEGQLVKFSNGFVNATWLNGQTVQVLTASPTQFTAVFNHANYGSTLDTATATPVYSGENLLCFELDISDAYIVNTLQVIESSPDRSGDTFSSVSLVTPVDTVNTFGNGKNVELYYESHPKVITFKDQLFTIKRANRQLVAQITAIDLTTNLLTVFCNNNFVNLQSVTLNGLTTATYLNGQTVTVTTANATSFTATFTAADDPNHPDTGTATLSTANWDIVPTSLFTFTGRYTDDRLTVTPDTDGDRYLSQTYWSQSDHPEGIVGNVLLGSYQNGTAWFFHPIFGSIVGGSIIQASLSVAANTEVNMAYLLEPFNEIKTIPPKGLLPAYPLHISTVDPVTLATVEVAGFYNAQTFTWLRSSKNPIDQLSLWAVVGERQRLSTATETYTIPTSRIVQVVHDSVYWEDASVTYTLGGAPLVEVETNPLQGQYDVEPSDGSYVFSPADVGVQVTITYSYVSSVLPVYESLFNVPPIAVISPSVLTTVYRGQPITISGSQTTDADSDPIKFFWTENYPIPAYLEWSSLTIYDIGDWVDVAGVNYISLQDNNLNNNPVSFPAFWLARPGYPNVTITPSPSGTSAVLNVSPLIGGDATTFTVGFAAVDYFSDNVTPRHPALNVTALQITGTTATFTVNNIPAGQPILPLVAGEQVMTYSVALAAPVTPTLSSVSQLGALPATYFFTVTYLNSVGESTGSGEATITTLADFVPQVTSPAASGDAVAYNVYASDTSGTEQLQTPFPIPLGTPWTFPVSGFLSGVSAPPISTAFETFLNDQILLVLASPAPTSTAFSAAVAPPAGYTAASVAVSGDAMPQFQYAKVDITVPFNNPPTITFPSPAWLGTFNLSAAGANSGGVTIYTGVFPGGGSNAFAGYTFIITAFTNGFNNGTFLCSSSTTTTITLNNTNGQVEVNPAFALSNTTSVPVPRNSQIEITPLTITNPTVQLPVVYGGISDVDDVVTYAWAQVGGTPVVIAHGNDQPVLTFDTNGVNIDGELLTFQLTLDDGVNPPAIAQCSVVVAAYVPTNPDTLQLSRSIYSGNISQRNQVGTWGTLQISTLYSDLYSIKRNSVIDGTDRYILISPSSILVYGGISPTLILLRKLFTPNNTRIVDAVHTEMDYTLVIDDVGNLFRYGTPLVINTDDPDTTIPLGTLTAFTFNKIYSTYRFANQRIILLGGPQGLGLLLVQSDTLQVLAFSEISIESNLLYGADNVQFFRTADVENLRTGRILVGTIANARGTVTAARVIDNDLVIFCQNNFQVGDQITLTGFPLPFDFLNNRTVEAILTTPSQFQVSYEHPDIGVVLNLTAAASAIGPSAIYTGTITGGTGNAFAGKLATVQGFINPANNGTFPVTASSNTTITLSNAAAVNEIDPATIVLSTVTTGLAVSQNDGQTFETLIDLPHNQIIGTWDASKLINQFVDTGEILFNPQSPYSGFPLPPPAPVLNSTITPNGTVVTIAWDYSKPKFRPDLAQGYVVDYSIDGVNFQPLQTVGSGAIQSINVQLASGQTYYFMVQVVSLDGNSAFSPVSSISI